jgi:hypothetical protein
MDCCESSFPATFLSKLVQVVLPLDRMTTIEKLQTMEALWEDLSKKGDEFISPSWHGAILSERDKNLAEGNFSSASLANTGRVMSLA